MTGLNAEYINCLKAQINSAASCAELQQQASDALQTISDQIAGISVQLEPLNQIKDLLEVPDNIGDVISWVGNYITIVLTPMYKPYLTYVQQLAALPTAIADLQQAINDKMAEFESCSISMPPIQFPELPDIPEIPGP